LWNIGIDGRIILKLVMEKTSFEAASYLTGLGCGPLRVG
jgi:hypothetical protein